MFKAVLASSSFKTILKNIGWLLSEKIVNILIGVLISIMLARYLGPEDFGVYNLLLASVALMAPIASLGLNGILTKEYLDSPDAEGKIFATAIFMRTIAGIVSLFIMLMIFYFVFRQQRELTLLLFSLGIGQVFTSFSALRFWFEAKVLSKYIVKFSIFISVVAAIAKVVMVYLGVGISSLIVLTAIEVSLSSLILIVPYARYSKKIQFWNIDLSLGKSLIKRSWWLILSGVAAIIYMKIDQIMLGKMVDSQAVGIYAVAARFSEVWYFVPLALMSSLFPSMVKAREKGKEHYEAKLQMFFDLLFWLAFIIAAIMTFISTPFIQFLYGDEYLSSANILSIHIWAGLFVFMRAALSKWLIVENLVAFSLVTHGAGAIINVFANLLLIPLYGGEGAAIATLISYATASWLALYIYPKTRHIGNMMFKSLFAPYRLIMTAREA